jgi:hypothetical protein
MNCLIKLLSLFALLVGLGMAVSSGPLGWFVMFVALCMLFHKRDNKQAAPPAKPPANHALRNLILMAGFDYFLSSLRKKK